MTKLTAIGIGIVMALAGCAGEDQKERDAKLAADIAAGLAESCPTADPGDEIAQSECAAKLSDLAIMRDHMREPFIWGGQKAGAGYRLDASTNKFNARVWRRLYLATFMFETAEHKIEQIDDYTVLHVTPTFRHSMEIGAYPYPFWHADGKWKGYSYATALYFIIQDGEIIGALRSADQDTTKPLTSHTWDGNWMWEERGEAMPYVTLFSYLFTTANPHVAEVDRTYRALEAGMRAHNCQACHAPDNQGDSAQLEFFVYPAQTLAGRNDLVTQLDLNLMPPANNKLNLPVGIASESDRQTLIQLARDFQVAGNKALEFDGNLKDQYPYPLPMQSGGGGE